MKVHDLVDDVAARVIYPALGFGGTFSMEW
jgi:hypothetical protein